MKKQSSRARAQSMPTVRHQLDHVVPTVIHNPEEKMTALGRLAHHAMLEPRRYLGWPAALIGGVLLAVIVMKLMSGGTPSQSDVWTKLELANSPSERVDIAKANPQSPAATWALLQAATGYADQALADLPGNKDVALTTSKKALDLFDQVIREAPHDAPQARIAAMGRGRVLEMRNALPKAIEQYESVVKEWPDSPEAVEARRHAEALKDPEAAAFYKELYAYSPPTVTLPPEGTATFPPSGLGSSLSDDLLKAGPAAKTPSGSLPTLPRDMAIPGVRDLVEPKTVTPPPAAAPKSNAPATKPEAAKPTAAPKASAPAARPAEVPTKKDAPATRPEPPGPAATQKNMPADVFAPKSKGSQ